MMISNTVCFESKVYQNQNIFLPILMDVSNQFISQLFNHPHFKQSFFGLLNSFDTESKNQKQVELNCGIDSVAEEITHLLETNFKTVVQNQCHHLFQSNRMILQELEQLKSQLKQSPTLKTQSSTAQRDTNPKLQTSIFFQTDSQYDMKQIRKQFQDEVQNRILVNSFQIDQQERTYIDQEIEEKINASIEGSISRIELTLEEKFDKYSAKIQQRIEQLRKTIASVVQAMNEKDFWNSQSQKTSHNYGKYDTQKAFSKKQHKPNFPQKQNKTHNIIDTIQQHQNPNQLQIKNPSISQQKEKIPIHNYSNPNKTIESLNKSINFGRTKIKSLFGFKSQTGNKINNTE